jgi:hypothetical protein
MRNYHGFAGCFGCGSWRGSVEGLRGEDRPTGVVASRHMLRFHRLLVACVLLAGCQSDPGGAAPAATAPSAAATASAAVAATGAVGLEGIYAVERITKNSTGCDAEGPVVEPEVTLFYLRLGGSAEYPLLSGGGATSMEDCRKLIRREPAFVHHPVVFTKALDSAEPKGALGQSAMPKDGICHSEAEEHTLRRTGPDRIAAEIRLTKVDYPGKEMSDCGTHDSIKAAAGKPCSALTVVHARRTGDLPGRAAE